MISLNSEQQSAVDYAGNLVVTACPGSGKTRVLTARVIRGLSELQSRRERVIALTFTNRAADEIQSRLDQENVVADQLWAGTIHSFALEWVLRPYAPYCEITRYGFSVADEFQTEQMIEELKSEAMLPAFTDISTTINRSGDQSNTDPRCRAVFERYKANLREEKLIDYDDVLYLAYSILRANAEIAATLASIVRLICVDEVQDIQDLQFGILSEISKVAASPLALFFVGDANQSIYESIGALTKTPSEIGSEFGLTEIGHLELQGNYRSTQRIIDFYRRLRPQVPVINSRADYAKSDCLVTFENQTISKDQLAATISGLISSSLNSGVASKDICVLAPHWWHVRSVARQLVGQLPEIEFDAPGLSPLYSTRDNFWFKVARLFLTTPSPSRTRTRVRWAKEILSDIATLADVSVPEVIGTSRRLLRVVNSISSTETGGIPYLRDVFSQLSAHIGCDLRASKALGGAFEAFFKKAEGRLAAPDGNVPADLNSFRRLFSHPSGVVVSTCHGVKGEEYETVIAFGLLRGYIPHWSTIINDPARISSERESKLLYVICSRAKRRLHLIAESGRSTQKGNPYETATLLRRAGFDYDQLGCNVI